MEIKEWLEILKKNSIEHNIFIVGAGKYGVTVGEYLNKCNITWKGFIDKDCSKKQAIGKKIYGYDDVHDDEGFYLVGSGHLEYRQQMIEMLRKRGVADYQILEYDKNLFRDLFEYLNNWKSYVKKTECFHDKHKNERCFIVGNGPSLRKEDLEKLKNEYTFASNRIFLLYNDIEWRPTYYVASDPTLCRDIMKSYESLLNAMEGCEAAFTLVTSKGFEYRDKEEKLFFFNANSDKENNLPFFSVDCVKGLGSSGTVTYYMLQLAVYMGFSKIYLLGMDCSYSHQILNGKLQINANIANHIKELDFDLEKFKEESFSRTQGAWINMDEVFAGYLSAKAYANSHNICIYNATRGGNLEIFERIQFDDIV